MGDKAGVRHQVVYRHYRENGFGEQGNGPEIGGPAFGTREEAEAEAARLETRNEGRNGGSHWTAAHVVEVGAEGGRA